MNHAIDEVKARAYVLCAEADNALRDGSPELGGRLMEEAAAMDSTYRVRSEYFGQSDDRVVRVQSAIQRILRPAILASGFTEESKNNFRRKRERALDEIFVGRNKFGHRLGLMVAVCVDDLPAEYFDWKTIGNRSGSLAYRTQQEVEGVCRQWASTIETEVLPWFGRHP